MSKINTNNLVIPEEITQSWQNIVNLLAEIISVPAALIMRIHPDVIEVVCHNNNTKHPYHVGDSETLGQGLYCEYVIQHQQPLTVANALNDQDWANNPDIKLGMVAYCGFPINWPNGDPFGTICVLDAQTNHLTTTYKNLLQSFRDSIQDQLVALYQNEKLTQLNMELKSRVITRTQDLVDLNYSLNIEIDKRRAAEQKVLYHQRHDLGTGFLNQNALEFEANQMVKHHIDQPGYQAAAIHIGFANGKLLQAKHGYDLWENILVQFRERLGNITQFRIITARPASTELVMLIQSTQLSEHLKDFCQHLLTVSHSEFEVEGENHHLHSYIGISTTDDATSGHLLLKYAAEAMHSCKDSGHKYSFHSQDISTLQTNINQLESYLLQAVRSEDLLLYFQPKVCPTSHRWTGAEALLRWRHPILGHISNETLIHMAEQNGLIFEVGTFVLRSAIQKAAKWTKHMTDFKIAVNISAVQLKNVHFAEQIEDLLTAYQLPAQYLELEVTESGLIADEVVAKNTLDKLHKLGITLALDDFGTGYSSFNYLKKFPFDAIKIDKSFIHQLDQCEEDKEIVRSIINVAKKMNLSVTVEGIENKLHEEFIIAEGCEFGQGFFYGKPMPCDEFEAHLLQQNHFQAC